MNYRNSKLFFIPVAVALLSACVNVDKTLGTDLVPDNYDVNVEYVEFDVPISTDSVGAVVTSSTSVGAVGYLNHPEFGLFTAGSVFRILPYTLNFDYGEGAVADSAILTISVSSRTQLSDKEPPQQLSLYRLNRDLAYSTAYYNNSLKENNDLGEKIADYTYEGGDTIKIKLKDDFVNELLEAADEVTSDSLFLKTVKGLYLKAENPGTDEGQVSYFSLTSTYITLHYHTSSDTSTAYYFIEQGTPNFNVYTHSSSSLTGSTTTGKVYLEGLAGVKPRIDFDQVKDSITNRMQQDGKDISKLVINKAELIVPVDYSSTDPASLASLDLYPKLLTLAYAADSTYTFLPDTYLDIFGGALNRSLMHYSFNLTYYVQGFFNNQTLYHTSDTKMYLYPLYSTYDSYGSTVKLLERTYYSCGVLKSKEAKLKLTYTMLK